MKKFIFFFLIFLKEIITKNPLKQNTKNKKLLKNNKINITSKQLISNNKTSFPKSLNVRNLGLLDTTNNLVGDLIDIINSTVGGLVDVITGDEQINQSESENNDLKDNPNYSSPNDNTENNPNENNNNKPKSFLNVIGNTIIITGQFLSNADETYNNAVLNLNKLYVKGKVVKIISDIYSLIIYDTLTQPNKTKYESIIDLSSCEKELKKYYNISNKEPLTIIKMDSSTKDDLPTEKVSYSVYDKNFRLLNSEICSKIIIEIPIKNNTSLNISKIVIMQNNGIDLTDKSDLFFNDICTPYDNDDSNGMPFNERTSLYVNQSFCRDNCDLNSIKINNGVYEAECYCGSIYKEKAEEKKKKNFVKSVFNSNIFVVKCYKLVFNSKRLKKNLGHWIYFSFISCQVINFGFFLFFGLKALIVYLLSITIPSCPPRKINKTNYLSNNKTEINNVVKKNNLMVQFNENENSKEKNQIRISNLCILTSSEDENIISITESEQKEKEITLENNEIKNEKDSIDNDIIDPKNLTEDQLEKLPYEKAVKYDNRNFGKTYTYSILHKQSLLSVIFIKTNYKLTCVKISTLFIVFTLNTGWNAFFFSQSLQKKRYKGDNSIWIRIPKVILSCFSSIICCFLINLISSYEKDLNKIIKNKNLNEDMIKKFIKKVKVKLIMFYSLICFFSLFFWYFCTAYCAVYPKYEKPWLYDSLQSMILAQISPFVFCFLYVSFRLIGIKCGLKVMFLIGKFLDYVLDSRYKKFLKICGI